MSWEYKTAYRPEGSRLDEWLIGLAADGWKMTTYNVDANGKVTSATLRRRV